MTMPPTQISMMKDVFKWRTSLCLYQEELSRNQDPGSRNQDHGLNTTQIGMSRNVLNSLTCRVRY